MVLHGTPTPPDTTAIARGVSRGHPAGGERQLTVVTCSISGTSFAKQLGLMVEFLPHLERLPRVWMGCSGGALACWMALLTRLDVGKLREILGTFHSSSYSRPWLLPAEGWKGYLVGLLSGRLPTLAVPPWYDTLRQDGIGLASIPTGTSGDGGWLPEVELWLGLLDCRSGRFLRVCNRKRGDVTTNFPTVDGEEEVIYVGDTTHNLVSYVQAGVSINGYVAPVRVGGRSLSDGGLTWPSPLSQSIETLRGQAFGVLHFGYGDTREYSRYRQYGDGWPGALRGVVTQINSVRVAYEVRLLRELLLGYAESRGLVMVSREWERPRPDQLAEIAHIHSTSPSIFDIYALTESDPDIFDFTGETLVSMMDNVHGEIGVRGWWLVPDPTPMNEIGW